MMYRLILTIGLLLSIAYGPPFVWAQEPATSTNREINQNIQLKDGSIIKGRLIEVKNGYYTIRTQHMGAVKVHESQIDGITSSTAKKIPLPDRQPVSGLLSDPGIATQMPGGNNMLVQSLYNQLLSDPQITAEIQAIVSDPEVAALLGDQNLLEAALSMDPQKIQNNPNAMQLMQHPKMQRLMEIIANKLLASPGMMPGMPNLNDLK